MDNLNASITDKTGKEIVEAIQAIAGGGGSGSPFLVVNKSTQYPGNGDDPYEGNYQPYYSDERPSNWLNVTVNDIINALSSNKSVVITEAEDFIDTYEDDNTGEEHHTRTLLFNSYALSQMTIPQDASSNEPIRLFFDGTYAYHARTLNDYPYMIDSDTGQQ